MKRLQLLPYIFILLFLINSINAQPAGPNFNYKEMVKREEIANFLSIYDWVAWVTSDSMMALKDTNINRLGMEWFCYNKDDQWYAIYGRYEKDKDTYEPIFVYNADRNYNVKRYTNTLPDTILLSYARALNQSLKTMIPFMKRNQVKLNWYVQSGADGTISVWYVPAMLNDGRVVYGGDFRYRYDKHGKNLIDSMWNYKEFRAYELNKDKEINLIDLENEVPSVGNIFFVIQYRKYFKNIWIRNKNSTSSLLESDGKLSWVHVDK